jgi:hypothetical protein
LAKDLADQLEQAMKANAGAREFEVNGFFVAKIEGLGTVTFSTFGKAGAVNPPGIALAALESKLPNKNNQLAITGHERVVLIVNWALIVGTNELIEACSQIDFSRFPNIDKIYFESRTERVHLVFDRALFRSFETLAEPPSADLEPLYFRWLEYLLVRREPKAFELVKKLAGQRGSLRWLPVYSRQQVVLYGEGLIKTNDWDNVLWIVREFKNDPDPGLLNDPDDAAGQSNYHLRIQEGEEVRIIATVRGHLCWLLQRMVCENRTELYPEIVDIVENYARGENLYIRQQSTVPLIELARRRHARQPNDQPFMTSELTFRIRTLAFRMLRDNISFPRVLEWVARVFVWIRDLNDEEAGEVLCTLLEKAPEEAADDISQLLIYFAIFRKDHFPELGTFDSEQFSKLLSEHISRGPNAIRAHITWLMWKLLEGEEMEFTQAGSYVTAVPDGPYDSSTFHHFYQIIAKHIDQHADLLCPALKKAFQREREFIEANPREVIWNFHDTWNSLGQVFEAGQSECFLGCVKELLQYRHRIDMFPTGLIEEKLAKVEDQSQKSRAIELLEQLRNTQ